MEERLKSLRSEAISQINKAQDEAALEAARLRFLGRKGELTQILREIGRLSQEERPRVGQIANQTHKDVEQALERRKTELSERFLELRLKEEALDVTLPGRPISRGHLHPVTLVINEIVDFFSRLGFQVAEGPDVETDWYNFQALNIPPDHPARDMWDTLYISPEVVLRTHTSPVQIRAMEKRRPPVRIIAPGRVYRYEAISARSLDMFHQVEGFAVDEQISFADLKGILEEFARAMFGEERTMRFRASYFPFTEPSAEADIDCFVCRGKGCRVCKHTGWLEILGSGMVHPRVLRNVGYDPEVYQGFAFGMGVERIAMLKYGIDDIRLFVENDLRFLKQF